MKNRYLDTMTLFASGMVVIMSLHALSSILLPRFNTTYHSQAANIIFSPGSTAIPEYTPGLDATSTEISQSDATSTIPTGDGFLYIEIIGGCGPYYDGDTCVNMRSGPSTSSPVVARLRDGIVLKVEATTTADNMIWFKVIFDGEIKYPERITSDWYIADDPTFVRPFRDPGDKLLQRGETASTTKHILVDLSQEILYAYDGDTLFMEEPISTGLELTPTQIGDFTIFKKTPSRYMQGPIPEVSDQYYDLPGVPWNLYFTFDGAVIHGAYWHDHFGELWSHGCVNLEPQAAKRLYEWADVGTPVKVQE